jgi:peptidyl-dipeptidase Dcp
MKTKTWLASAGVVLLTACAANPMADSSAAADNPLLTRSPLPYQYPQFDKIRNEHYAPAFAKGMAEQMAEIAAIAGNPEAPTFDNTIVAMERSGVLLDRVNTIFSSLSGAHTNDEMKKIDAEMSPKLSAHYDEIFLNGALYNRVKALFDKRDTLGLDAESARLLERYHVRFVRAGARLSDAQKEKLKALNGELATLETQFTQNLQNDTNASAVVVDSKAELDGMSEDGIAAAAEAAKARKLDGKYVISLILPTPQPALAQLKNRALRERIFRASTEPGNRGNEFDNKATLARIARLRAEHAAMLGYKTHADYVLEVETAKTKEAVNKLLGQLTPAAVANAKKEAADMQKLIDQQKGAPQNKFKLAAWDWAYYSEQVRKARYDFDESQMKPYFELDRVLKDGVFYAAGKVYGLTFKERKDLPVYQEDVRVFDVFEESGKQLGIFLFDPYARESKRGGAWMNAYVSQSKLFGDSPVVANHLNIPEPPAGQPALLTFDEVSTMFHEFGHALHGLFSNVKYPYFSGTSVPRDFVEYPSQVNEMWMTWPEVLKNYARHYQTGEPMPQALLAKVKAAEKFNQGFTTTEYLAASLLDQAWHQLPADKAEVKDVIAFEADALKKAGALVPEVPTRYRSTYFNHVFGGGYSAGYYSYIWSEVLDADTVEWFKEQGGMSRKNGDMFRAKLLSKGGSVDAIELFKGFRGREPDIKPLLDRRGLK